MCVSGNPVFTSGIPRCVCTRAEQLFGELPFSLSLYLSLSLSLSLSLLDSTAAAANMVVRLFFGLLGSTCSALSSYLIPAAAQCKTGLATVGMAKKAVG
jgi:hypothetical protein